MVTGDPFVVVNPVAGLHAKVALTLALAERVVLMPLHIVSCEVLAVTCNEGSMVKLTVAESVQLPDTPTTL